MTLSLLPAIVLAGVQAPAAAPTPAPPAPLVIVEAPSPVPDAAIVTARTPPAVHPPHAKGDPYESFNRKMFERQQGFDRKFLRPAAMGYKHAVPKPARDGLRNAFSNLGEPIVFLNYLLQLKPGKAAETLGRFMINSTLGIGGLFDLAKSPGVRLPHRPNGFGDTLGYYGVKPGPYLFLPFFGPTTLRDFIGGQGDGLVLPFAVGLPYDRTAYQIPKAVIGGLDARAEADDDLRALYAGAVDPYASLRSVFLQNRAGEIAQLHGRRVASTPAPELGEPLEDPAGTSNATRTAPSHSSDPALADPLADPAAAAPAPAPKTAAEPPPSSDPALADPLTDPATRP